MSTVNGTEIESQEYRDYLFLLYGIDPMVITIYVIGMGSYYPPPMNLTEKRVVSHNLSQLVI